ncbi:hypothetical protein ACFLSQ_00470 [Bacteroidota bacterium]
MRKALSVFCCSLITLLIISCNESDLAKENIELTNINSKLYKENIELTIRADSFYHINQKLTNKSNVLKYHAPYLLNNIDKITRNKDDELAKHIIQLLLNIDSVSDGTVKAKKILNKIEKSIEQKSLKEEAKRFKKEFKRNKSSSDDNIPINNVNINEELVYSSGNIKIIEGCKRLIKRRDSLYKNGLNVIVYAKLFNSKSLIKIKNGKWPEEDIEISYNIIRDSSNEIIYLMEFEHGTGDGYVNYEYYFDESGKTIIFCRSVTTTSDYCHGKLNYGIIISEYSEYYFDSDFNLVYKDYSLTDSEERDISKEVYGIPYRDEYIIYKKSSDIPYIKKFK